MREPGRLRIGYLWQYDGSGVFWPDESVAGFGATATRLHVGAIVRGFQRNGHQVKVLALRGGIPQCSSDLERWSGTNERPSTRSPFRVVESIARGIQSRLRLPFFRLFDSYHFSDACMSALKGYDVLYERFFFLNSGGLITARRLGVPLVLEVNGDLVEEFVQQGLQISRLQWAAIHLTTRLMFNRADQIVAVSEPLKQRIVGRWGTDPSKIAVVNNGADVELFSDLKRAEEARSTYGLGQGPLLIFVGAFMAWHGIDLLVEAFARVVASGQTTARLVLVGDGPMRSAMEQKVNALPIRDRVVFVGIVPHADAAALLSIADVAVLAHPSSPSATAGSPLKLFEYMAAGRAIVAPALPNLMPILRHRENALLVPPNNPVALADAVIELLESRDLGIALGRAARKQAVEKHSWDRVVDELEGILYRLVGEPGKQSPATRSRRTDHSA